MNAPPAYQFLKILTKKGQILISVINNEILILYTDSVVRITSHVKTFIIDLLSNPMGVSSRNNLSPPAYKDSPVY